MSNRDNLDRFFNEKSPETTIISIPLPSRCEKSNDPKKNQVEIRSDSLYKTFTKPRIFFPMKTSGYVCECPWMWVRVVRVRQCVFECLSIHSSIHFSMVDDSLRNNHPIVMKHQGIFLSRTELKPCWVANPGTPSTECGG